MAEEDAWFEFVAGYQYLEHDNPSGTPSRIRAYPGDTHTVPYGTTINAGFKIRNTGTDQAPCSFRVDTDTECKLRTEYGWLPPYSWYSDEWHENPLASPTFTMGDESIVLKLRACRYVGGTDWITDEESTITLLPEKCYQEICVTDMAGNAINGATLTVEGVEYNTGTDNCRTFYLVKGKTITVTASKTGYNDNDKTFTIGDNPTETIKLTPLQAYCDQEIDVQLADKAYNQNSGISVCAKHGSDPSICCTTNDLGECTLEDLKEGKTYNLRITKSGYETITDTFTACTSKRSYTMYPSITYCDQTFKAVEYETGNLIRGFTVTIAGVGSCTDDDNDGFCTIDNLQTGNVYSAIVTHPDYDTKGVSVTGCEQPYKTVTLIPKSRIDTEISDFTIKDENGNDVTILEVGKEYSLRACLKTIDGAPIQYATLYWRKGDDSEIGHWYPTDGNGYAGISWTPTDDDIGTYTVSAEFDGSDDFNSSSASIGIEVQRPLEYHNFNIVYGFKWGFDYIVDTFDDIILAIINGIAASELDVTINSDRSYYDRSKKELVINADIPTHSPVSAEIFDYFKAVAWLTFWVSPDPVIVLMRSIFMFFCIFKGIFSTETETPLPTFIRFMYKEGLVEHPVPDAITAILSDGQSVDVPARGAGALENGLMPSSSITIEEITPKTWALDDGENTKRIVPGITNTFYLHLEEELSDPFSITVKDENGLLMENVWVHILKENLEVQTSSVTDENGLAHFDKIPRKVWLVVASPPPEMQIEGYYGQTTIDLTTTPYTIPDIIVAAKYEITKYITETVTKKPLDDVSVDLVNKATGDIIETKKTKKGWIYFLIDPNQGITYELRLSKTNYNDDDVKINDKDSNDEPLTDDKPHYDNEDLERTGDIADVKVVVEGPNKQRIPGALVQLNGLSDRTNNEGFVKFEEVDYGNYQITVQAEGFTQENPEDITVGDACQPDGCEVTITLAYPAGLAINIECQVKDENDEPVPEALIDIDVADIPVVHPWKEYEGEITVIEGELSPTAFKGDGNNVQTNEGGYCKFSLPAGTYSLRAGKAGYYNEKGKEDWTERTGKITASPGTVVTFTLTTKPPEKPVKLANMLIYSGVAMGCYGAGSLAPEEIKGKKVKGIGTALKFISIVPAALAVYEGVKIVQAKISKIPFL